MFETEYPLLIKEPPTHISAEMEKVVDIPCQARGQTMPFVFKSVLLQFGKEKERKVKNKKKRHGHEGIK